MTGNNVAMMGGKNMVLIRIPVTFNNDNTADVGEITVEPGRPE